MNNFTKNICKAAASSAVAIIPTISIVSLFSVSLFSAKDSSPSKLEGPSSMRLFYMARGK